jgi:hypothetical protein
MADTIMKGEVAEIYVEAPQHEAGDDLGHESVSKVTALTEMNEDREREIISLSEHGTVQARW